MKNQHLHEFIEKHPDPLINRTFGGLIEAKELITRDGNTLTPQVPITNFHAKIYTLTKQTDTVEQWRETLGTLRSASDAVSLKDVRAAHQAWWNQFWQRSWFFVSGEEDAETVSVASPTFPATKTSTARRAKVVLTAAWGKHKTDPSG